MWSLGGVQMKFIWSPDILNTNIQIQVYSRWTPDGLQMVTGVPAGVHLNFVGECKVLLQVIIVFCTLFGKCTVVEGMVRTLSWANRTYEISIRFFY
jgi:hypothetical protein